MLPLASIDHLKVDNHANANAVDYLLQLLERLTCGLFDTLSLLSTPAPSQASLKRHSYDFLQDLAKYARRIGIPELMPHEQWNKMPPLSQNQMTSTLTQAKKNARLISAEIEAKHPGNIDNLDTKTNAKYVWKQDKMTRTTIHDWTHYKITFEGEPRHAKEVALQIAKQLLFSGPSSPLLRDVAAEWCSKFVVKRIV
ncbi:hypothetical protein LTR05_008035 [Lithohypha guttulata]|uniref:Uncharacterized protein n=1 Tax=Lithohypha guttulata TaxID=1690604 RepID=A0AAN7STN5_9EURO|nr:hypothetical protein LTR05_008035 [Lithohypha guttulata]